MPSCACCDYHHDLRYKETKFFIINKYPPIRIVGGDFNQLHTKAIFQELLTELDATSPPLFPTFRKPNGYSSPLDFFLIQLPSSSSMWSPPKFTTFWPEYQPTGHGIHMCKFPRICPVTSQPDDTPATTIPTSAFYSPPSYTHSHLSSSPPSHAVCPDY